MVQNASYYYKGRCVGTGCFLFKLFNLVSTYIAILAATKLLGAWGAVPHKCKGLCQAISLAAHILAGHFLGPGILDVPPLALSFPPGVICHKYNC